MKTETVPILKLFDYIKADRSLGEFLADSPTVTREQAVAVLGEAVEILVAPARDYSRLVIGGKVHAPSSAREIFPSRELTLAILGLKGNAWAKEFMPTEAGVAKQAGGLEGTAEKIVTDAMRKFQRTLNFLLVRLAKQYRLQGKGQVQIANEKAFEPPMAREIMLALPIYEDVDDILGRLNRELFGVLSTVGFRGKWGEYVPTADNGIILEINKAPSP